MAKSKETKVTKKPATKAQKAVAKTKGAKPKPAKQKRKTVAAKTKAATPRKKVVAKVKTGVMTGAQLRAKQKQTAANKRLNKNLPVQKSKVKTYVAEAKFLAMTLVALALNVYKVNLGFLRFSRPDFFEFIANVFGCLDGNDNYPTPSPAIADIEAEIAVYRTKKTAKNTTGANQALTNIKYMMKQLAIYVANTCNNDLDAFNTSGFIANALKPGPQKEIGQAVIREILKTKHAGKFYAIVEKVDGANYYRGYWRSSDDPEAPLTATRGGAGIKVLFTGVPVNVPCDLYVIASGPLEDGDISPVYPYTSN